MTIFYYLPRRVSNVAVIRLNHHSGRLLGYLNTLLELVTFTVLTYGNRGVPGLSVSYVLLRHLRGTVKTASHLGVNLWG